jgi:hypothetical protein
MVSFECVTLSTVSWAVRAIWFRTDGMGHTGIFKVLNGSLPLENIKILISVRHKFPLICAHIMRFYKCPLFFVLQSRSVHEIH